MKALNVKEAVDLARENLQGVPGLKASEGLGMWKVLLWFLGTLYPRYVLVDTQSADNSTETKEDPA